MRYFTIRTISFCSFASMSGALFLGMHSCRDGVFQLPLIRNKLRYSASNAFPYGKYSFGSVSDDGGGENDSKSAAHHGITHIISRTTMPQMVLISQVP